MADDPEPAERVRRALHDVPDVHERRTFGSLGFFVDGTLPIAVGTHPDHGTMVRTGGAQDEALGRLGAEPAIMRGRPMTGWVFLEREAIVSDEQISFRVRIGRGAV